MKISSGERLSDQIYLDLIGGRYSCFRLLNGTHEIGCGCKYLHCLKSNMQTLREMIVGNAL